MTSADKPEEPSAPEPGSSPGSTGPLPEAERTEMLESDAPERTEILSEREPPAQVIDRRYEVVRVLGEGGFGKVYLVRDQHYQGELRALKTIQPTHSTKAEFETRFRNEIRVLRALSHKGIPQIYNDGKTPEGEIYYTMAYVEGRTLSDVLKKEAPLRPDRIVRLVRQMLHILEYAHGKSVVHRDLKPANVMLVGAGTADEEVKVLDFGIAKVLRAEGELAGAQTLNTSAGMGTPYYMSPEQVRGQDVDARSDLYALGIIIYQMCSGLLPFSGKTDLEIATARLERAPAPLEAKHTPPWLRAVVMQMLERNKEKRPNTKQIFEQFERIARGQRDIMRSLVWIAAGMLIVAFGVGWLLTGRGGGGGEPARVAREVAGRADVPALDTRVRLKSPANGAFLRETMVLVAGDAPSRSAVLINGASVAVAAGRFEHALELPADAPATIVVADAAAPGDELARVSVVVDARAPAIACAAPGKELAAGSGKNLVASPRLLFEGSVTDLAPGELDPKSVELDDEALALGPDGSFSSELELDRDGEHIVRISAADRAGNVGRWSRIFVLDTRAPRLELDGDASFATSDERVVLRGRVADVHPGQLFLRRSSASAEEPVPLRDGAFECALELVPGENRGSLVAEDLAGNRSEPLELVITREKRGIRIAQTEPRDGWSAPPGQATVLLSGTADQALSRLKVDGVDAEVEDGGRFTIEVALDEGANELELVPYDADGVPGTPLELVLKREKLALPVGCTGVAEAGADAQGRALRVLHQRTGIELVLVPTKDSAFYLGATEVTFGQYRAIAAEDPAPPDFPVGEEHPVVKVSFADATRFCAATGLRLPTPEEWALAARGPEGREYPWGDDWIDGGCNAHAKGTSPAGSFSTDESWCGARDMAGNVSEWCSSASGEPALRGGSWSSDAENCKLSKVKNAPRGSSDYVGFRVCLDLGPYR